MKKITTILTSILLTMTATAQIPNVTLNNGMTMPQLGVGTFLVQNNVAECVAHALRTGFRLIDTAQGYGNEKGVGEGIRLSGVPREEIFLTSKINTTEMRNGTVRESIDKSLADLGVEYIDLMLIHWPVEDKVQETWQIMEEYVEAGKIRAIGLSNFNPHHINSLLTYARIKPVVNQIEIHPYMTQYGVSGHSFANGIQVESWGPLGQGKTQELDEPAIKAIAERHGKSPAQIILRWHMQRGLVTIPRCDNPAYVKENIDIFDFELTPAEMETISGLNLNRRTFERNDPDSFPW